jgi:hypothetical protein
MVLDVSFSSPYGATLVKFHQYIGAAMHRAPFLLHQYYWRKNGKSVSILNRHGGSMLAVPVIGARCLAAPMYWCIKKRSKLLLAPSRLLV